MADKPGCSKGRNDMPLKVHDLDKIAINVKSHKLLKKLLIENPKLEDQLNLKK